MQKNTSGLDFVDKLTLFAMRQVSRRGFIKISGGAVTLVGTIGAWFGLSGFSDKPDGGPQAKCPPPCVGLCLCLFASGCTCGGKTCTCLGACDRGVYYQAFCRFNLDTCEPICGCSRC